MLIPLFEKLSPNTLILTANRRLATWLNSEYAIWQQSQGTQQWQRPAILPLASWLQQCFDTLQCDGQVQQLLLQSSQSSLVWQQIIKKSLNELFASGTLIKAQDTAKVAEQAWQALVLWQVQVKKDDFQYNSDCENFYHWLSAYQQTCQQNAWLDQSTLAELIYQKISQQQITLPQQIIVVGFSEMPPLYSQILQACELQNCSVQQFNFKQSSPQVQRFAAESLNDEVESMLRWALQAHSDNPQAKIACVIPELTNQREQIAKAASQIFQTCHLNKSLESVINISGGKMLNQYDLINTALLLLRFCSQSIKISELSYLLHCAYLNLNDSDYFLFANIDQHMHELGIKELTLTQFCKVLVAHPRFKKAQITARMQKTNEIYLQAQRKQSPSAWLALFSQLLTSLAWPGTRQLSSLEFQLIQRWQNLLNEFSAIELIEPSMFYQSALKYLQQLASRCLFQIKTQQTPIQVLGLLEANGLPFDYLWVAGMHAEAWPATSKPNPFIPIEMQRQLGMPHADAQRELTFSQQITKTFAQSGQQVIFSFAQANDERELLISPLIKCYEEIKQLELIDFIPDTQSQLARLTLEKISDEYGPKFSKQQSHGGASLLKHQAACPFKAFAKLRLQANSIEQSDLGFAAWERGALIHEILQKFWQQVKNSTNLHQLTETQLETILQQEIEQTLASYDSENNDAFYQLFYQLEKQRLLQFSMKWLEFEKQQSHEFEVVAVEDEMQIKIGGLELQLKVDRVDCVYGEHYVVIDYKTGYSSPTMWFGDRPDEPQMPLYALSYAKPISGLLFAQLKNHQMSYKGYSDVGVCIDKIAPIRETDQANSWQQQKLEWRQVLNDLAEEFISGYAAVSPKYETTCQQCDLHSLCRIYEKSEQHEY